MDHALSPGCKNSLILHYQLFQLMFFTLQERLSRGRNLMVLVSDETQNYAQWLEVYAVMTGGKKNEAGISKKSNVLSLRCKKVCPKRK